MQIVRATLTLFGMSMLVALAACSSASISVTPTATATVTVVPPGATTVPRPVGPAITKPLATIDMFTAVNGWGAARGGASNFPQQLAYTADGGHTWVDVTPDGLTVPSGDGISFAAQSLTDAWVYVSSIGTGSSTTLWHTTDAGTTWNSSTVATTGVNQIDFVDVQNGWLAASPGGTGAGQAPIDVWHTTNGGASWTKVTKAPPVSGDTTGISFVTATTGFAAAGASGALLDLAVTHDGGATWNPVQLLSPSPDFTTATHTIVMPPVFTSATNGDVAVDFWSDPTKGKLVIYRTSDAGATWDFSSTLATSATPTGVVQVVPISVTPDGSVFAAPITSKGFALDSLSPLSAAWKQVATTAASVALLPAMTDLDMLSTTSGWAITSAGVIGTTDGGVTWTKLFAGTGS